MAAPTTNHELHGLLNFPNPEFRANSIVERQDNKFSAWGMHGKVHFSSRISAGRILDPIISLTLVEIPQVYSREPPLRRSLKWDCGQHGSSLGLVLVPPVRPISPDLRTHTHVTSPSYSIFLCTDTPLARIVSTTVSTVCTEDTFNVPCHLSR